MEERRPDRRVIKTKRAIHTAFAQLLTEKDLNDITVKDIADLADINRKTFYNYYAGVYAVVDEIENEVIRALEQALVEIGFQEAVTSPYLVFEKLTAIINTDLDFYGHLLSMQGNLSLITKIVELMKKKAREAVTTQLHIKEDQVDILLDFMFSGMLTVYQHWFNSDRRQSLEEISETLCVLCFHGLNGVLPEE